MATNLGPILIGNMYGPPDAGDDALHIFDDELEELAPSHRGTPLLGDFNVHQGRWLKHSNAVTTACGRSLRSIARHHALLFN